MKVSLVATVKDAAPFVGDFLASIEAQTRPPDEVVIVDGGSTDGTQALLRRAPRATVLEEPGANIARGRNLAVAAAAHDVIAVSDADCVLAPDWLERVVRPVEDGAEVAVGFYRPLARGFFQACAAAVSIKERDEVRPGAFLPSARSLAFRRSVFEAAGGFPEWMEIGEDMYLNHRWRALGVRMEHALDAVAYRRPRPTPGAYWRQFSGYAEADARGGLYPRRHALRFAVYGALALTLASGRRVPLAIAGAAGAAYAARPLRRAVRLLPRPADRLRAVVAVPALMAITDLAKMAGYLRGALRGGPKPPDGE